jgi:translation initiation factor 1A
MVKNTSGGSKTKGQARKFVTAVPKNTLRTSTDELEIYAQVTKNLGNGMCHVLCIDGVTRLCHIRGKFRGRGKKDNFIGVGTLMLIGLREWEISSTKKTGKLDNCDVLEVYNDYDVKRLKDSISEDWSIFQNLEGNPDSVKDDFEFEDNKTSEYHELIEAQIANAENNPVDMSDDYEIDVDDI